MNRRGRYSGNHQGIRGPLYGALDRHRVFDRELYSIDAIWPAFAGTQHNSTAHNSTAHPQPNALT
eukprot:scaffold87648_cov33-Phaeocystis_antarctica.AAC.1